VDFQFEIAAQLLEGPAKGRALSRGFCSSHSTAEMTVATSRMMTRKFSNCSASRFHDGVSGAPFSWFGP
jgi:hypothetical protein